MAPLLLQHILCVLMFITLHQALATSAQLSVQPLVPGVEVTLLPERAGEGREEKS